MNKDLLIKRFHLIILKRQISQLVAKGQLLTDQEVIFISRKMDRLVVELMKKHVA